ncbi:MAG: hypothetical protein CL405_00215, partial [Acidimicrobiaceae bacterium]|nr:hypothetical protein [Acidimicrobiaceae bacterium]
MAWEQDPDDDACLTFTADDGRALAVCHTEFDRAEREQGARVVLGTGSYTPVDGPEVPVVMEAWLDEQAGDCTRLRYEDADAQTVTYCGSQRSPVPTVIATGRGGRVVTLDHEHPPDWLRTLPIDEVVWTEPRTEEVDGCTVTTWPSGWMEATCADGSAWQEDESGYRWDSWLDADGCTRTETSDEEYWARSRQCSDGTGWTEDATGWRSDTVLDDGTGCLLATDTTGWRALWCEDGSGWTEDGTGNRSVTEVDAATGCLRITDTDGMEQTWCEGVPAEPGNVAGLFDAAPEPTAELEPLPSAPEPDATVSVTPAAEPVEPVAEEPDAPDSPTTTTLPEEPDAPTTTTLPEEPDAPTT